MKNFHFKKVLCFFAELGFLFSLRALDSGSEKDDGSFLVDTSVVPLISSLKFEDYDEVLLELSDSIEQNDILYARAKNRRLNNVSTTPHFYAYVPVGRDNLFSVNASTGVPYDTLATLNSLPSSETPITGKKIILTDIKGLFIPEKPVTEIDVFLYKTYQDRFDEALRFQIDDKGFYFFEGERFSPYHRLYFLDSNFSLPLDKKIVTSAYGMRESPVYGTWKKHNGIDFAAREGDNVYSCRIGTVSFVKQNDEVFGNYIIVSHSSSLTSVYAHLSKILVNEGDSVKGGQKIGLSGSTGMVTGPHLHFEIRRNGKPLDPERILPKATGHQ